LPSVISSNVFAHPTNVNMDNRLVALDLYEMGEQLRPTALVVTLEAIQNRVMENRKRGKFTWVFIDECYLYFKYHYSGEFLYRAWKRFRKYAGIMTAATQNVEECLKSETARLMLQYPTIPCNDCKYCMPCPYGLDIPTILLHYNKCVNEGNVSSSSQDENYRKARRAFLVGYDRSVPKLRQANHCIGCNKCRPHCPLGINIPRRMRDIDNFVEQLKQGTLA